MRRAIEENLVAQGFAYQAGSLVPPPADDKTALRDLHARAVAHRIARAREGLARHESRLLSNIANSDEVVPEAIRPRLLEVERGSDAELLFRYARLHWSIPVSAGYGRRLRFLLMDESNGRLMGIIGLADPVYSLGVRDRWIGWSPTTRREQLHRVMDAFVLGAIPPYNNLLVGKFVAMAVTAAEVRHRFVAKYGQAAGRISGETRIGDLALITTASALGRSSVYNRLRIADRVFAQSVGYTQGFGEFQFSDGLYELITEYARRNCEPTAKDPRWGSGFRNRREVVKKVLQHIELPADALLRHGVRREVFVFPLGPNARVSLACGEIRPGYTDTLAMLWGTFRERWLLPRSRRLMGPEFHRESWRLWPAS